MTTATLNSEMVEHDAHFTNAQDAARLASEIVELYDPTRCRYYLEPSSGGRAFVDGLVAAGVRLDHIRSADIDPKNVADVHGDFLTSTPESLGIVGWKHVIIIGNPPFGKNGDLARAFLNKACKYGRLIAFIVPRGMYEGHCCSNVEPNLGLIHEEKVPDTFSTTKARCNWQVWRLGDKPATTRPDEPEIDTEGLYEFVSPDENFDVVIRRVGSGAGKVTDGDGTAGRYFLRVQDCDVFKAIVWLWPQGLDDISTHQRTVSKTLLHAMIKEALLRNTVARIADPCPDPPWMSWGLDILKANGTWDEMTANR